MNVEVFREILNICPRIPGYKLDEPPSEEEALSFIRELGHSGEIKYITDEYLAYQIDNKDFKKQDKMLYPRFIKIIIHHFLKKDKSISMRNRTFMHIARDDSLLGVPDEQHRKTSGADEGTEYGDDNDGNDDDDDSDQERTESDRDEIPNLNQFNEEQQEEEEKNVDELSDKEDDKENEEESDDGEKLYKDVNVNLRKEYVEMTDVDKGEVNQHNVSHECGFEQEEEDAHVTLTTVHDTKKTVGPMQSSSVSSDFTEKLLNFENVSPADNEIASLMDTWKRISDKRMKNQAKTDKPSTKWKSIKKTK
ncbi:hypothetical protein Tco_0137836 [Tanacetum coccineum]